jgi:delta 1-pyrroline-5-carboxylate dehydrogenase
VADSSALPEQVVDAVVQSAFRSAGQRCSALRLLCVHEGIADAVIAMIRGALDELTVGDPELWSTDVGPVIDDEAFDHLPWRRGYSSSRRCVLHVPLRKIRCKAPNASKSPATSTCP